MTVTLPANSRGPVLDLSLPPSEIFLAIVLRNQTTSEQLTLNLDHFWSGADLTLDFRRRTITDEMEKDRSDLLDPSDTGLWHSEPLIAGFNDVEIEIRQREPFSLTKSPGTLANDATVGTVAWSNPGNAASSDDVRAAATLGAGAVSNYLKATNYGFVFPAGSEILGVEAPIECRTAAGEVEDSAVKLVKGGVIQATNRANVSLAWPGADSSKAHGGGTDLWGTSLTQADVESSNFGIVVSAKAPGGAATANVDHLPLAVAYEAPVDYDAVATLRWEKGYY